MHIWLPPCPWQRQVALQLLRLQRQLRLRCSCPATGTRAAGLQWCIPSFLLPPGCLFPFLLYSSSSFWRRLFLDILHLHHLYVLPVHLKTPVHSQVFLQDTVGKKQSNRPSEANKRGFLFPSPHQLLGHFAATANSEQSLLSVGLCLGVCLVPLVPGVLPAAKGRKKHFSFLSCVGVPGYTLAQPACKYAVPK